MRTTDQISNLRKVFFVVYGPIALFCPDETIDLMANKLQSEIDRRSEWTWEIKVLTTDFDSWENVKPEPKQPSCTVDTITRSCERLFKKYPAIVSILVVAKENRKLCLQFNSQ